MSFVVGTTVETPDGPTPIEQLRPGDEILTRDDADPATLAAEAGYVKRIFKRIAPAVIWLTLLDGTTIGVTPEHEVYTEEQGWRYVSELETSASLADASGAPLTIVAIEVDPTPRPVYNLETSCGTYFAQGVWAHNCNFAALGRRFLGRGVDSAKLRAAVRDYPGKANKFELHHIVPKYMGGPQDGPLVKLNAAYHQKITNAFRKEWPYGSAKPTFEELEKVMEKVYREFPLP